MTRRVVWLMPLIALTGCKEEQGPVDRYALRGVVVRIDAGRRVAMIKHEKIDGLMEAMTMEFPVRDPAEFGKLREGARIRATLNRRQSDYEYWLSGIELDAAPAGEAKQDPPAEKTVPKAADQKPADQKSAGHKGH